MGPASIQIADEYWASELGCERGDLRPKVPRVQAHAGGLLGYPGVFVFVADAAPVVSVPPPLLDSMLLLADRFRVPAVRDTEQLKLLLSPVQVTRVIGPALLHYSDLQATDAGPDQVRALSFDDTLVFQEFVSACPAEDWDPKGLSLESDALFGAFSPAGRLDSTAAVKVWRDAIAHILVVTRPEARGNGCGTRAVAAAVAHARRNGLLPQYRVLEANAPSRRLAYKLGFRAYGWTIAARFANA